MTDILPNKLFDAEKTISNLILTQLNNINNKRLAINLKFEGLRLMPIATRLANLLVENNIKLILE